MAENAPSPDHYPVNIITFDELMLKSQCRSFDVLVADCEGALFYIFNDFPELLDMIKVIIMENDYYKMSDKQRVDEIICSKGFKCVYNKGGGWGPCTNYFFQVWKKTGQVDVSDSTGEAADNVDQGVPVPVVHGLIRQDLNDLGNGLGNGLGNDLGNDLLLGQVVQRIRVDHAAIASPCRSPQVQNAPRQKIDLFKSAISRKFLL